VNVEKLKKFIFGEIQRRVSTKEFRTALRAYLVGRLGQLLRSEVLDTRMVDRDIALAEQKKRRLIDSIAEGLLDRHDPVVARTLAAKSAKGMRQWSAWKMRVTGRPKTSRV
jgi:hypothetical protein